MEHKAWGVREERESFFFSVLAKKKRRGACFSRFREGREEGECWDLNQKPNGQALTRPTGRSNSSSTDYSHAWAPADPALPFLREGQRAGARLLPGQGKADDAQQFFLFIYQRVVRHRSQSLRRSTKEMGRDRGPHASCRTAYPLHACMQARSCQVLQKKTKTRGEKRTSSATAWRKVRSNLLCPKCMPTCILALAPLPANRSTFSPYLF
jgi:hypothetical protein